MNSINKSIYLFLIITIILFFNENTWCQIKLNEHKIIGTIADSVTKKPLPNITIYLKADTSINVGTTITKTDGSFNFNNLSPLSYTIEITAVGYHTKTINIHFTSSLKPKDFGTIFISNKISNLKEVVVTAKTPLIKQEIDKITYDLQADPESKGNSVLEMMRKVPFLSVDGDENILLKGSSSYKILINGKPSSMVERNPRDILRSMPASTIKSIEVITTPSSKYDAEGLAGIINIITNKKIDNGYNGTINLNQRFPVGGPGAGGSFAFKQNKFGISAIGGASKYHSPATKNSINRTTTAEVNSTELYQNSTSEPDSRNNYFSSEVSYEIDSLNLISAQFNINGSTSNSTGNQNSILSKSGSVVQHYAIFNNNESKGKGIDAAVNYQRGFKQSKERLLTLSYRYMKYNNFQFNTLDVFNFVNYLNPDYNQANDGSSSEQTFQLDYVHAVKKLNIEGGLKGILRTNKSEFQYHLFNTSNNKFELDSSRSNKFINRQNVFAAYNTYQYNLKQWGFKGGLRIEQTIIDANFISTASQVAQNYFSIIPAFNVAWKFKNMSNITFAYTNRVQRPGISTLNPFVDRSNPDFESSGNPNLKPAYTHIFQLSYTRSKKATFNIALGYMHSNSAIGPVTTYNATTKVTRTSYENVGKASVLKTNIYINYPITKKWNVNLNSDIRYVSAFINTKGELVKNEGLMEYVYISSGYRFNKSWRINTDITLKSGGVAKPQSTSNGFTSSSFGLQKEFVKSKFTFSASISNPFTKYRHNYEEIIAPDFIQVNSNQIYFRSVNASLNYRFGKLKEAIKKNKRGINNDDLSN